ncbi:hypothetical protein V500_06320 [Pseudogymnoascus sp. VKM F-4518 (FW-2643)]|nr:hypothetical protein V500_06320 [Pseudogymnoascus sp. VKM F-4518 (FW-2643)]
MVGHNGVFEDYLDLGVRAVINPEIRCYLEKIEDGADKVESELGEGVSNLGLQGPAVEEVAEAVVVKEEGAGNGTDNLKNSLGLTGSNFDVIGSVDEDMAETGIEGTEKEDDGIDNTTYGIREAISNLHLTGSINQDAVDEDAVIIKQEDDGIENTTYGIRQVISNLRLTGSVNADVVGREAVIIKQEQDGTDNTTYEIRNAISNLHLTESIQNSLRSIQAVVNIPEITITPPSPPNGLEEATSTPDAATPANNEVINAWTDGPWNPGSAPYRAAKSIGEAMAILALQRIVRGDPHIIERRNLTRKGWEEWLSRQVRVLNDAIDRGEYPSAVATLAPQLAPQATATPESQPMRTFGCFRGIGGIISHFYPAIIDGYPAEEGMCCCRAFDREYEAAMADPGFEVGPDFLKMSPLARVTAYLNWKAASVSQTRSAVYNPAHPFQGQIPVHVSAPVFQEQNTGHNSVARFQAHNAVYNQASIYQIHSSAPRLQNQTSVHNSAPHFQAQPAVYNPVPMFQAQPAGYNPASTFHAASHPSPARTHTAASMWEANPTVNFFGPSTAPLFNPVNYSAPAPPPTFHDVPRPAAMQARTVPNMQAHGPLAVPKTRQSPSIKTEDEVEIKTEPGRRHSDSGFERKRARDADGEAEDLSLERPRKFSG